MEEGTPKKQSLAILPDVEGSKNVEFESNMVTAEKEIEKPDQRQKKIMGPQK
jgi:hypothetical protein